MGMLLVTLFVMLLVVSAMSVGVLFGRKPIAGSCGGVGQALGQDDYVCDLCGNDENKCEEIRREDSTAKQDASQLAYDANNPPASEGRAGAKH